MPVVKSASVTGRALEFEVTVTKWPDGWEVVIDEDGKLTDFRVPDAVLKVLLQTATAAIMIDVVTPLEVDDRTEREVFKAGHPRATQDTCKLAYGHEGNCE